MITLKHYEAFLIFPSTTSIKDLNIFSLYYKKKIKNWGASFFESQIYFLNSKYINNLKTEKNLLFCLKFTFTIFPLNINLVRDIFKLNLKLKKSLIISK